MDLRRILAIAALTVVAGAASLDLRPKKHHQAADASSHPLFDSKGSILHHRKAQFSSDILENWNPSDVVSSQKADFKAEDDPEWPGPTAQADQYFVVNVKNCDPSDDLTEASITSKFTLDDSIDPTTVLPPPVERYIPGSRQSQGCDASIETTVSSDDVTLNTLYHAEVLVPTGEMAEFSWVTVTNATDVLWSISASEFVFATGVYIWVDAQGTTRVVGHNGKEDTCSKDPADSATNVLTPNEPPEEVALEEGSIFDTLPEDTYQAIQVPTSPQAQALTWLEEHPDIDTMEEWQKRQLLALVTFYYAFNGEDWPPSESDNYLSYAIPECVWGEISFKEEQHPSVDHWVFEAQGNQCHDDDRFQRLRLFAFDADTEPLRGTLPREVTLLTQLEEFELYRTWWTGSFPDVVDTLTTASPEFINSLRILRLDYNMLTGSIPPNIVHLSSLEELDISRNSLTGPIPTELSLFSSLHTLTSVSTSLTGTLPTELALMTELRDLNLYSNDLTGTIPTEFGLLTAATSILLLSNMLSGTVPSELGLITGLRSLAFGWGNEDMYGTIPDEICALDLFDLRIPATIPCPSDCGGCMNF